MNAFQIKLVAVVAMVVDHVGAYFFPTVVYYRIAGRLAFPLFAWLLANGYRKTGSVGRYVARLGVFAVLSQAPFFWVARQANPGFWGLNIFVTLFLGLIAVWVYERSRFKLWGVAGAVGLAVAAQWLRADYGAAGVAAIVGFHLTYGNLGKMLAVQALVWTAPVVLAGIWGMIDLRPGYILWPAGLAAIWVIRRYNGQPGRRMGYWFYAFYPLHLLAIYVVKSWFL